MRLEFESGSELMMLDNSAFGENPEENAASNAYEMLQEGIKAAQAGERAEARALLLRAAELDPSSENTWLWLASISEYPEELLEFLDNVLAMNPSHERALDWAAGTKSLLSKTFAQRGIDAVQESMPEVAVEHFEHAIEYDKKNAVAWHWLASLSDSSEREIECLEKALAIDPDNESARAEFDAAQKRAVNNKLADAQIAAVAGNAAEANEILDAIVAEAPNTEDAWILKSHVADGFDEKVRCFERVLEINPDNPAAKFGLDSLRAIVKAAKPQPKNVPAVTDELPVELRNEAAFSFNQPVDSTTENAADTVNITREWDPNEVALAINNLNPSDSDSTTDETKQTADYQPATNGHPSYENNTGEMIDEIMEVEVETHEELQMFDSFKETEKETPFKTVQAFETDESFVEFPNFDPPRQPADVAEPLEATYLDQTSESTEAISKPLEPFEPTETHPEHIAKGRTILVVDDSATVRNLIAAELEKYGHNVLCSADGVEAMDRLNDVVPDLILLDITMPGMNGYQVCKKIRDGGSTKDVPIVMISGKDGFFDKIRGDMAGTTGYITKPFGPETLMKAIETYLKSAGPADGLK